MSQRPRSRRTILSRAQSGGAATEPYTFIASPEGVRRWPTYSFNARARVHSLQPVLRPSGFCSKASRACPFQCIAQPVVKCTNGFRRTHRSAPHEYHTFRHRRVVLEPRLKCGNPRCGETGSAQAHSAVPIRKNSVRTGPRLRITASRPRMASRRRDTARQRRGPRDRPPSRNWRTK
jgi:hypothetical protein